MLITVLTPTFNRASLLPCIYQSLCRQHYHDFEWLIIDDGSTDDTIKLLSIYQRSQNVEGFPIRYYRKVNGGKHTAINMGVRLARGELTMILDSDDELPDNSLDTIALQWNHVKCKKVLGGLCGYMAHRNGEVIGTPRLNTISSTIDLRYKYGVKGDMCEVYRTEILREYPFPEYEDERFVPEALVWNRIACKYKLKVFEQIIYYRDYLNDGLTSRITEIRRNSPKATCLCYKEMMQLNIPIKYRLKALLNYIRFKQNFIKI